MTGGRKSFIRQWLVACSQQFQQQQNNATILDTQLVSLCVGFVVVYIYNQWCNQWWKESFIRQQLVARMLINSEAATTTTMPCSQ
jgi:hypothetical protein